MALTYPDVVPTKYQGDYTDYLHTKVDRDGCARTQYTTVTVPASTASSSEIGLVPFNKGARLVYGASQLATADLDTGTSVTLDIGYIYEDSAYTSDPNAFASALTTAQTGGLITFDEAVGLSWVAEGNGWIAVTTGGGSTTTEGAIYGQITLVYDGLNAAN